MAAQKDMTVWFRDLKTVQSAGSHPALISLRLHLKYILYCTLPLPILGYIALNVSRVGFEVISAHVVFDKLLFSLFIDFED